MPDHHQLPGPGRHRRCDRAREIGDDRNRFPDDRDLQAFAGSAPVTRASGKSRTVTRRRTQNNRLAAIGYSWAFTAAARPSATRDHYLRRRQRVPAMSATDSVDCRRLFATSSRSGGTTDGGYDR